MTTSACSELERDGTGMGLNKEALVWLGVSSKETGVEVSDDSIVGLDCDDVLGRLLLLLREKYTALKKQNSPPELQGKVFVLGNDQSVC